MLIIGAKGFAKELLEIIHQNNELENLSFYDDINEDVEGKLYGKFPILKSEEEAKIYFKNTDARFVLGLGKPHLRKRLGEKFKDLGGVLTSIISHQSFIGNYGVKIGKGSNILSGAILSNDVELGEGCIIYYNSVLTHDCKIGDYVEISPGVKLLGRVNIGDYTHLGSGSIILPDVTIGKNVIIGAGAVVKKDIPDNCTAVGIPAKIIN